MFSIFPAIEERGRFRQFFLVLRLADGPEADCMAVACPSECEPAALESLMAARAFSLTRSTAPARIRGPPLARSSGRPGLAHAAWHLLGNLVLLLHFRIAAAKSLIGLSLHLTSTASNFACHCWSRG
jgi:hypothetical protein